MRNTLGDLNNHLFAQLERLGDEEVKGEELAEEIKRAEAVSKIASQIVANGTLVLKAKIAIKNSEDADDKTPKMLEGK